MDIHFDEIIPLPIRDEIHGETDIWGQQCHFEKGKWYNLFAPSGAGKSTFVQILYGLRNDYNGQVKFGQRVNSGLTKNEWAEIRKTSFSIVFQDLRLFPELSADENIKVKSVLTPEDFARNYEEWADLLGVKDQLTKAVKTLSYGERQRIAIIRSLVQPFEWLILDEPFSHLDNLNTEKAANLIDHRVRELGAGLILTSLWADQFLTYDHKWHI